MVLYVIDDHPLMREAVVMLLRRLRPGSTVIELERLGGIESAVRQNGMPDLICLDLKLPDTTGTSGIHELKKRYPEAPLAVLSASPVPHAPSSPTRAAPSTRAPTTVRSLRLMSYLLRHRSRSSLPRLRKRRSHRTSTSTRSVLPRRRRVPRDSRRRLEQRG